MEKGTQPIIKNSMSCQDGYKYFLMSQQNRPWHETHEEFGFV